MPKTVLNIRSVLEGILGKTNACVPHMRGPQYNVGLLKHLYHPAVSLPYPSNCTLSQSVRHRVNVSDRHSSASPLSLFVGIESSKGMSAASR